MHQCLSFSNGNELTGLPRLLGEAGAVVREKGLCDLVHSCLRVIDLPELA